MSLSTFSVFYETIFIDLTNNAINFNEGSGELLASVDSGSYSLTDILVKTVAPVVVKPETASNMALVNDR